jgi:SagB-type dehydrogenase family enzyme
MKRVGTVLAILIGGAVVGFLVLLQLTGNEDAPGRAAIARVKLPAPRRDGNTSVEQALLQRRSVREYRNRPTALADVAQLLWAAQGVTEPASGFRTAPSAGALYPLEVYAVVGNVEGIQPGVYKYRPLGHELERVRSGDVRAELSAAALEQTWIGQGAIVVVFCAVYERTTAKYGDRGIQYVHIEVGHAAQNLCLQAVSLNLGAGVVGAFHDRQVKRILNARANEEPLYVVPVGVK